MERQESDSLTEGDGWGGGEEDEDGHTEISQGFQAIEIPQQLLHTPVAEPQIHPLSTEFLSLVHTFSLSPVTSPVPSHISILVDMNRSVVTDVITP